MISGSLRPSPAWRWRRTHQGLVGFSKAPRFRPRRLPRRADESDIAQEEFGLPDILEFREVDKPRSASSTSWSGSEQLLPILGTGFMRGMPYMSRPQAGWRKPKNKVLGSVIAGQVEAVGERLTLGS